MHEGYFGAVGCLDNLVDITQTRKLLKMGAKINNL